MGLKLEEALVHFVRLLIALAVHIVAALMHRFEGILMLPDGNCRHSFPQSPVSLLHETVMRLALMVGQATRGTIQCFWQ
jgi:hypothetical protein